MNVHSLAGVWRSVRCALFALPACAVVAGCGGGSGGGGGAPPGEILSGTITDVKGSAVVGATVTLGARATTSTQFGTFEFTGVTVPAGQNSLVTPVTASAVIGGHNWTGQNTVEILAGQPNTSNVQIVISDASTQGSVSGVVVDTSNNPLPGARVFAAAPDPASAARFTTLSSFTAFTDQNGAYTLSHLPPLYNATSPPAYTVTASFAGHVNQTISLAVAPNGQVTQNFSLAPSGNAAVLPAPSNLSALSITTPTVPTRSPFSGAQQGAFRAIRYLILRKKRLLDHRAAAPGRVTLRYREARFTPSGSIVEDDLFWDYAQIDNLFGYDVLRSTSAAGGFASIALLSDPLADRFSDVDNLLTPDAVYYYSVARLDDVGFPTNGTEGPPVNPPVSIQPLGALSLSGPLNGATVPDQPTLSWTSVNRAADYQILVYSQFPNYQSDTDPNGVLPIWPQDISNPGASLVPAPQTSQLYQGPALTSGTTYYWAVVASDASGSEFAVSPVRSFVAQ